MGIFTPNLEKMQKKKDFQGLVKALRHKDDAIQKKAVKIIGEMGDS